MLRLALPNGSLQKDTMEMLARCGLAFDFSGRRYTCEVREPFPIRATLMRPQHIAQLVWAGNYDTGICGWTRVLH